MRYTPRERAILEKALYLTAGSYPFALPMGDTPPHPQEGWKAPRGSRLHQGLDFNAPIGSPVSAIGPGIVTLSRDWGQGTGKWIVIEHTGSLAGFQSRYIHLNKRLVKIGDRVNAGDLIAHSGITGRALVPHLHLDIQADLKSRPEIRSIFTKKFIGRDFHGKRNIPGEVLLPLADEDRPGVLEPRLAGWLSTTPTERWFMPPPGVPLIPPEVWIASAALSLAVGAFFVGRQH